MLTYVKIESAEDTIDVNLTAEVNLKGTQLFSREFVTNTVFLDSYRKS